MRHFLRRLRGTVSHAHQTGDLYMAGAAVGLVVSWSLSAATLDWLDCDGLPDHTVADFRPLAASGSVSRGGVACGSHSARYFWTENQAARQASSLGSMIAADTRRTQLEQRETAQRLHSAEVLWQGTIQQMDRVLDGPKMLHGARVGLHVDVRGSLGAERAPHLQSSRTPRLVRDALQRRLKAKDTSDTALDFLAVTTSHPA